MNLWRVFLLCCGAWWCNVAMSSPSFVSQGDGTAKIGGAGEYEVTITFDFSFYDLDDGNWSQNTKDVYGWIRHHPIDTSASIEQGHTVYRWGDVWKRERDDVVFDLNTISWTFNKVLGDFDPRQKQQIALSFSLNDRDYYSSDDLLCASPSQGPLYLVDVSYGAELDRKYGNVPSRHVVSSDCISLTATIRKISSIGPE